MTATAKREKEPVEFPPINYLPIVTEYSWWSNGPGTRKFVIVRIHWDFDVLIKPYPSKVDLLQFEKTEPVQIAWSDFINYIEKGEMKKIIN
jgi:hypothetical protein